MTKFNIKYDADIYNKIYPLQVETGCIIKPLSIQWKYEGNDYSFSASDDQPIASVYLCQDFILVQYAQNKEFPEHHLFLYNLRKEIIKWIKAPELISRETRKYAEKGCIEALGNTVYYGGKKYLKVSVGPSIPEEHYFEQQLLDLTTFNFHPSFANPIYYG
ncbi:hypothetical protein [Chryseobacterium populi]|uniref:Uncharacterized protein n=1 Tax=Chryseobacterium populi TaxID=1144316 RepID=J2KRK5_9FLAO|nr:hypothetical protein [Chryseobacterium populi]EJL75678.1 hypothetical protein PMI13_00400 [Chryseobacterium populi]